MRVAVAQLNYIIGDFEGNKIKIINAVNRAKEGAADLVVFAEQAISGTPAYDLLNNVHFLEMCEEALVEIAACCENISVLVGLPLQHGTQTVSAAALIENRKIVRYITKRDISLRDEQGFISPGKGVDYFRIKGHKVAVAIGRDAALEEHYAGYADTIINLSAHPYARAIVEKRYERFRDRAFTMGVNFIFANQVGGHTDVIYDGSSSVFNKKGEAVALLKKFEEDFVIVDLAADNKPVEIPYQNKTENVYKAMRLGLGDFFRKNGYAKACLGLSGGIDSAVVAAIAYQELGAENVRVLMLPSQFSSDHSVEDALEMAEKLGLEYSIVPITDTYKDVVAAMEPVFGKDAEFGITEENIQARLRCVMLMALSNKYGCMLLNTSNKSELAVGYGTLYGDNTGVLSIIGDVYKSEVFDLARYINREEEIIPARIIVKEPSAELNPEHKDHNVLPSYDDTDAVLYRLIEEGQPLEEMVNAGFNANIVREISDIIFRNEQKRYQFCPTLRVSTCPFGTGRVIPITSKYRF
jgi:NAD+ synthase (glutamine-hydrolysing)